MLHSPDQSRHASEQHQRITRFMDRSRLQVSQDRNSKEIITIKSRRTGVISRPKDSQITETNDYSIYGIFIDIIMLYVNSFFGRFYREVKKYSI